MNWRNYGRAGDGDCLVGREWFELSYKCVGFHTRGCDIR